MRHPADDFEAVLEHAYSLLGEAISARQPVDTIAVVMDRDGKCEAFALTNREGLFWQQVEGLMPTLRHGAASGAYRVAGYCGADLIRLPTDHRKHYALRVHLEHREGDAVEYALPIGIPPAESPRYEDWIRVDGERMIYSAR